MIATPSASDTLGRGRRFSPESHSSSAGIATKNQKPNQSAARSERIARPVVERVRVEFVTQAGVEAVATALVAGQLFADDPWLGTAPGETSP